jgi:hypothetical protein
MVRHVRSRMVRHVRVMYVIVWNAREMHVCADMQGKAVVVTFIAHCCDICS